MHHNDTDSTCEQSDSPPFGAAGRSKSVGQKNRVRSCWIFFETCELKMESFNGKIKNPIEDLLLPVLAGRQLLCQKQIKHPKSYTKSTSPLLSCQLVAFGG